MHWNERTLAEYGLLPSAIPRPIPDAPQRVGHAFDQALKEQPDKIALIGRHGRLSFKQVEQAVNSAAAFLAGAGVSASQRVAATAGNDIEVVIAFLAVQRLGAIWVGINSNYALAEKLYFLSDSGATFYLADRATIAQLSADGDKPVAIRIIEMEPGDNESEWTRGVNAHAQAIRPDVLIDPFAPAAIAYTSGTTGIPKGAVHSQHNLMVAAVMSENVAPDSRADVVRGSSSPLTILNMMILGPLATLTRGVCHVCMDRRDALGISEWIRDEKINTTTLMPTTIYDLLTRNDISRDDLTSLTWLNAGGSMVPEGLGKLCRDQLQVEMTTGYGQTELPTIISRSHAGTPTIQGAVGRPLYHLQVAILDNDGRECIPGESGEICLRATEKGGWAHVWTPPLGYWKRMEATVELLKGGWLHTDDLGHMDENGELYVQGRRSELIIRGGANIYPAEVERVLRLDERVVDCAVLAKPDARLGQTVVAVIQAEKRVDAEQLLGDLKVLCAGEIARYKIPVEWFFVDELPRNIAGKVIKKELEYLIS